MNEETNWKDAEIKHLREQRLKDFDTIMEQSYNIGVFKGSVKGWYYEGKLTAKDLETLNSLLKTKIEMFRESKPISASATTLIALEGIGVKDLYDLSQRTYREISKLKSFGDRKMMLLTEQLKENGLNWKNF